MTRTFQGKRVEGETVGVLPMQFVVDGMLGKLARWLRFIGYDVLYYSNISDIELANIAKSEKRLLITRDKELADKVSGIYVHTTDTNEQIKFIIKTLNLQINNSLLRCSVCNTMIKEVDREDVKFKVPENVYNMQNKFWYCECCKRIYWPGTHYEKILAKLKEL